MGARGSDRGPRPSVSVDADCTPPLLTSLPLGSKASPLGCFWVWPPGGLGRTPRGSGAAGWQIPGTNGKNTLHCPALPCQRPQGFLFWPHRALLVVTKSIRKKCIFAWGADLGGPPHFGSKKKGFPEPAKASCASIPIPSKLLRATLKGRSVCWKPFPFFSSSGRHRPRGPTTRHKSISAVVLF